MPELTADKVADLANTCLNLLLKGAMGQATHELQVLAGRVTQGLPAVVEQLLAEQRDVKLLDGDRVIDANVVDRNDVREVEAAVVETIRTCGDELLSRAAELGKLSQDEFNKAMAATVKVYQVEKAAPGDELCGSQLAQEQWQAAQSRLQQEVDRQRDALSLVGLDPARPGAIDLVEEQRKVTRALDASYPATVSDLGRDLRAVDTQLKVEREAQSKDFSYDRLTTIGELKHEHRRLMVDGQVAAAVLEHDVTRKLEECRAGLEQELARAQQGSTTALRCQAALDRLAGRLEMSEPAAAGRVVPWDRDLTRSACNEEYLSSVKFHADTRQENVWKMFEVVADLKQQGVITKDDPVTIGRAVFHMGEGSLMERTDAAHKMPGQLTIGLDQAHLNDAALAERFRIDNLVPAAENDLRQAVRGWFGTTTVAYLCVNAVDSLWEKKGLSEAFRSAVENIVRQPADADRQAILDRAYERFRADALDALDRARQHNAGELRELQRRPAPVEPHPRTLTCDDRENMARVMDEYQRQLEERRLDDVRKAVAWGRA